VETTVKAKVMLLALIALLASGSAAAVDFGLGLKGGLLGYGLEGTVGLSQHLNYDTYPVIALGLSYRF
jgi:hypothetical protein